MGEFPLSDEEELWMGDTSRAGLLRGRRGADLSGSGRNPQAPWQAQIFKASGRRCQSVSDSRKPALKGVYGGN